MPFQLPSRATVLFQGDSITDADRVVHPTDELGHGYAGLSAGLLRSAHPDSDFTFINRGIGGDRVADLRARWHEDGVALAPDLLSVLVGVNDTWRRYDEGRVTTAEAYEDDYRHILTRIKETSGARLLLIEPFLVPVYAEQWAWREDLDPRIHVVRRLAEEFDAALLAADGLLNAAARSAGGAAHIAGDGVHPTPFGHRVLARAWVDLVTGGAETAADGAPAR